MIYRQNSDTSDLHAEQKDVEGEYIRNGVRPMKGYSRREDRFATFGSVRPGAFAHCLTQALVQIEYRF